MPTQLEFLHLPTEVLDKIVKNLGPRDHSALRQTCWKTRQLVLAYVFRIVTLDFNQEFIIRLQSQCLERENGISRAAVQSYTREIQLIAPSRAARSQGSLHELSPSNETAFSSDQALSAFQRIERVTIGDCGVRNGAHDTIIPVLKHLSSLETLHSVHIILEETTLWPFYRPSYQLPHALTTDSRIENPSIGLLGGPSEITRLTLDGRAFGLLSFPKLQRFLRNVIQLKLYALTLYGLDFDAAGVEGLLPHLTHLRELRIEVNVQNTRILWPALETAQIKLQVLGAKDQASPQLLRYLSSFSGLQELSMSGDNKSDREVCTADIIAAIRTHSPTLRELDISDEIHDRWVCSDEITEVLRECTALQRLSVAVRATANATLDILRVASSLPSCEALFLVSFKGKQIRSYTEVITSHSQISSCIERFAIPDGSRLHNIRCYYYSQSDEMRPVAWALSRQRYIDDDDSFNEDNLQIGWRSDDEEEEEE
ncbi:hypothetical protein BZA77DRAFT_346928, partial [Pyronema omphalodes]